MPTAPLPPPHSPRPPHPQLPTPLHTSGKHAEAHSASSQVEKVFRGLQALQESRKYLEGSNAAPPAPHPRTHSRPHHSTLAESMPRAHARHSASSRAEASPRVPMFRRLQWALHCCLKVRFKVLLWASLGVFVEVDIPPTQVDGCQGRQCCLPSEACQLLTRAVPKRLILYDTSRKSFLTHTVQRLTVKLPCGVQIIVREPFTTTGFTDSPRIFTL